MAIKNWHWGKLVLCWVAGLTAATYAAWLSGAITPDRTPMDKQIVAGVLVVGGLLVAPIVVFVVTWKWLSGKEKKG